MFKVRYNEHTQAVPNNNIKKSGYHGHIMNKAHSRGSEQNTQKFFNTNGNISKKVGTQ
jgi:hypothetical protein